MNTSKTAQRVARALAIWWGGEDPIRLSGVPRVLPPASSGRRVSTATVYRWSLTGLRGVRLRRFKVGGSWHTTHQELDRWANALTALEEGR